MPIANYFNFNVITHPDPANPGKTVQQIQPGVHGLYSGGLTMNILIGVDTLTAHAMEAANIDIPSPIIVKALFDTGCTVTSIDKTIIAQLGLKPRGLCKTVTANGASTVMQHVVSILFPGTTLNSKPVHAVQTIDLSGQRIQALIGRDLMSNWTITYNGPAGFVSIAD